MFFFFLTPYIFRIFITIHVYTRASRKSIVPKLRYKLLKSVVTKLRSSEISKTTYLGTSQPAPLPTTTTTTTEDSAISLPPRSPLYCFIPTFLFLRYGKNETQNRKWKCLRFYYYFFFEKRTSEWIVVCSKPKTNKLIN